MSYLYIKQVCLFFLTCGITVNWSSKQREFHPKPLTKPDLTVSRHPALVIQI
jgi:hypothetical protein